MNFIHNIGFILLAIWLIVTGVCTLFSVGNRVLNTLLAIVAIVAGCFILVGR